MSRKMKRVLLLFLKSFLVIFAFPVVLIIRLIQPWLLVRWGSLISARIGHFAANTELYLCEQNAGINVPKQRHMDLFYMDWPACNHQLAIMWQRILHIWPSWILAPVIRINRLIPGGSIHEIGSLMHGERDVHNLLERFPGHLKFTREEEVRGENFLGVMGIPPGSPFVCLIVRDSAYLDAHQPSNDWSYHTYRDSDIKNYTLTAEALADRGYFVIRMGAKVREPVNVVHPRIVDYATNGMRNDFMDIYLCAKCEFCISTGLGLDAIPEIFRRPIVYVNIVPLGMSNTFRKEVISLTKMHVLKEEGRSLTMGEIFHYDVGFCLNTSCYESKGIELIENSPEEIHDVVIEMAERLNGTWEPHEDDEALQRRFWGIFPVDAVDPHGRPVHGEIRARFGASFLRNNQQWLQ